MSLQQTDPIIFNLLQQEEQRQASTINLIASENYQGPAVQEASNPVLANKYAEGVPGKRYYAGCSYVDKIEQYTIDRAKTLFDAEHANVQPHSGSQANMAIYFAALKAGDIILGMDLGAGGHLTHGHAVNFSGVFYRRIPYFVDKKTEQLNYDDIATLANKHRPKMIIAGASSYSRIIDFQKMSAIAQSVGAYLLADIAHIAGLVAAGCHPSPVAYADFISGTTHKTMRGPRGGFILCKQNHAPLIDKAVMPGIQGGPAMNIIAAKAVTFREAQQQEFIDYQKQIIVNAQTLAQTLAGLGYRIVSDGTDTHLFVIDLRNKDCTGLEAEKALESAGITVSRSAIPFDSKKPWIASGIRIGTPAITTRGISHKKIIEIAHIIDEILVNRAHKKSLERILEKVQRLIVEA